MDNTSDCGAIDLDMVGSLQLRAYGHVKARIMKRELRPGQTVTDSQIDSLYNTDKSYALFPLENINAFLRFVFKN